MDFEPHGIFGCVEQRPRAGDLAPDLAFAKVLHAPAAAEWRAENLSGQLTVLVFFPHTSHLRAAVVRWNALVESFRNKAVKFVWITGEGEARLLPFLEKQPIKGWVLHDPEGRIGLAYGLEFPEAVFIGADRRIIGFAHGDIPQDRTVNAALEGKITTENLEDADPDAMIAFFESGRVHMNPVAERMPRMSELRPKFEPSDVVHITPVGSRAGSGNNSRMDFLALMAFTLPQAVRELFHVNDVRLVLPDSLDRTQRYNFELVLPQNEDQEALRERMRRGIELHFHVTARRESREMDAYVVSVADRKPPAAPRRRNARLMPLLRTSSVGYRSTLLDADAPARLADITDISIQGTLAELCYTLERSLDRAVVDETSLEGEFRIHARATDRLNNDFLARLGEETGLVIAPARRMVELLVFEPA